MIAKPCHVHVSSFDLSKALTFSKFFSKIKLSPSSRLVLRCLVDFWNPKKGLVYPGQETISECTGISKRSVISAVEELRKEGLILTVKKGYHLNYYFTKKFFDLAEIASDDCKNFTQSSENISPYNKENKQINNKNNKILNFQKNIQEPNYLGVEETKKLLEDNKKIKRGSPLDFNENEAREYYNNLLPELKNSYFARKLKEKFNLEN